ncbi:hypothetical protein RUM44_006002 [Polyplax serrata]|uniref:Hexosyltransferase n=1 Tax=Polyplax serrata TaxID=468196 RepID=A0ABR1AYS8_POLSC
MGELRKLIGDVKLQPSYGLKRSTKLKKKVKNWGQLILGMITGLLLGLLTESNIFMSGLVQMQNMTCFMLSTNRDGVSTPQRHISLRYNEDPMKIIQQSNPYLKNQEAESNLVFVGVMTAQKYLPTRAVAVYETWGRELPGKIAFFSSETSTLPNHRKDLPLVRLRHVDDSYPPQKKSFMMLQYIWENYGDRFEWFIRADDDVYMRPDKLEAFLRSLDSRKPLFIGQAGRGNQEEFGLLSLEYDENFCMGGPGIIMSRETLKRVAPHIRYCLKNLYTTHEDVELGRCVRKFADVSCTWSYEMQTILYHNSSGYEAFTGNLKQKEVHRAITLHPVKQYKHMYRVHNYMRQLKIQELLQEIILLKRDLKRSLELNKDSQVVARNLDLMTKKFNSVQEYKKALEDIDQIGMEPNLKKFKATTDNEILHWDFIQRSLYSADNFNPRRRMERAYREGIEDVIRDFMETINKFSRQRGRVIEYQDLLYGYARMDPLHGADFILDLLLKYKKYRGRKMTVPVRRHAYLQRQFSGMDIRELSSTEDIDDENGKKTFFEEVGNSLAGIKNRISSSSTFLNFGNWGLAPKKKIINFILPLSGRFRTFLRFIRNYEEICLKRDAWTSLFIILFKNERENTVGETIEFMKELQSNYPNALIRVVPVKEEFARATALEIGARQCPEDEYNILFFIDVDMVFDETTLERIRLNTIEGKQVYFPIVFSEFDPTVVYNYDEIGESPNHYLINSNTGYWRQFGFGIASMHGKDLRMIGGYNTTIKGWGKEDVDVFDKFVAISSNITIFRSVDHALVHVFHLVECSDRLEETQLKMCRGTRKDTYGSVDQLANFLYDNPAEFKAAIARKKAPKTAR